MSIIQVSHLQKVFKIHKKESGFVGSITSLFNRKYEEKPAVKDVSFTIEKGELVGFIGPNGAGKTTTLKCLSGLLYPSGGEVSVLGFTPFQRKKEFLRQIALVMGQKNQLWWDLPPLDSFLLNKEIYSIKEQDFKKRLNEIVELLEIEDVLKVPVRNLSLGQRMKCELAGALLHQPKVLFLDEPTIGLDIVVQKKLRTFIQEYNKKYESTVILTSHYMEDVKELCKRVIIIDNGMIIFDGDLDNIVKKYAVNKLLSLTFSKPVSKKDLVKFGELTEFNENKAVIEVPFQDSNKVAARILNDLPVEDLNIEEPKIEDIIRKVFTQS